MIRPFALASLAAIAFFACSAAPAQASTEEASSYIEGIAKQALATISNAKLSKDDKQASLDRLFKNSVDIKWVARFVMGRFWRQATDEQKARYVEEYEKFLIHHYTSRFTDYTSGSYEMIGTKDDGENEYTVSMIIKGNDKKAQPVYVDYRVRKQGQAFKIFDVIVEGVSLITTQRSEFSAVITRHDIDYLIEQLKTRSIPVNTPK